MKKTMEPGSRDIVRKVKPNRAERSLWWKGGKVGMVGKAEKSIVAWLEDNGAPKAGGI